eukprot:5269884-Amphidinium_carterae.1
MSVTAKVCCASRAERPLADNQKADTGTLRRELPFRFQIRWMKAHLFRAAAEQGQVREKDFHGKGQADRLANLDTAEHAPLESTTSWVYWADFANKVFHFWRLVGPLLRERLDTAPRVRLPPELPEVTRAPFLVGHHHSIVRHATYLQRLDCGRQA